MRDVSDRLWHWFRRQRWWVQAIAWLLLWGPLTALWFLRQRGILWIGLASVPALLWLAVVVSAATGPSASEPTPTPVQVVRPVVPSKRTTSPSASEPTPTPVQVVQQERVSPTLNATEHTVTATPMPTLVPSPTAELPTPVPTATATPAQTPTPAGPELILADVVEVVDGDTIKVRLNGQVVSVRLIGVDTPETVDPNSPVMCYGHEASEFTRDQIARAGNRVLLEKDISETDRYGRLLRYVWLEHPDGRRMLNYELVAQGYAQVATYPPDVKYADLFLQAQREAREQGRGLWGACGDFGVPAATPTPVPPAQPAPPPAGNCDPAYPDVCIPPPPPDLDCGDIPYRRFRVLPPDPHRFDNDGDGVGCESG